MQCDGNIHVELIVGLYLFILFCVCLLLLVFEDNMTLLPQDDMIVWLKQRHDEEYKNGIQELYKTTSIHVNKNTTNPKVNLNKT